jgi:hypothetical protein
MKLCLHKTRSRVWEIAVNLISFLISALGRGQLSASRFGRSILRKITGCAPRTECNGAPEPFWTFGKEINQFSLPGFDPSSVQFRKLCHCRNLSKSGCRRIKFQMSDVNLKLFEKFSVVDFCEPD